MKVVKFLTLYFKVLPKLNNKKNYFVFPYYHLGGAETVHLDILKVFKSENNVCLITNESVNNHNKKSFEENVILRDISNLISKKKIRKIALKLIANKINNNTNPIVFGCNSIFFYDLIPLLKSHVKIIDLIHAFSYEEEYAAEKYSLPHAVRIDKRVVLGKKTLSDFKNIYLDNGIDLKYLNNIQIIKNKVEIPNIFPVKPNNEKLEILFVGRNSYEKRPELFFNIARQCEQNNLPVHFNVIGDFTNYNEDIPSNTTLIGAINDKNKLTDFYINSDLLLITSSREGFPMVVLEGMAQGVVPICTNVGEISEFINSQNNNGILINNSTEISCIVSDFVCQIEEFVKNKILLNELKENSFKSVKRNFSPENFTNNYVNLFKN